LAVEKLSQFVDREIQQKNIPALSIAIVDEKGIVWAQGFGFSDRERRKPATAQTIYRVGSVSKLLSDVAVVQLIEQGKLKLDDEIQAILPDFHPRNPFGQPITVRRLMNHQSGCANPCVTT
jgi:CubicO group peptidase (beta-lactamase class C family)